MRKRLRDDSGPVASWVTTYSDMMSLLLAFFVLLFSFSVIDEHRFAMFITSLQNYFGIIG